uniref:SH3 domain-containing protein n=1 Tax=Plectus sambesii TaxID=2011161 RepID=A0A914WC95_9BILA
MGVFRALATKVIDYNKKDAKDLKEMANKYSKEEKALIKQVQKGTANGDTLARFYQENQIDAVEQERRRYQFIAEKHREWLASYGLMFQTLAPIVNKEASPSKAVETPQQASNNQAAPPTTFTPPDVDSSISLSRSTSQSSTEAPPFTNDVRENDGNIAFVSMTRRDSTPVQTPVLKQHNGNHEDADEADYAQLVKSKKATPPPTPTEQPVQANVMPVQHDIVMLPAPTPAPIPAPPSPPPPPSNEKVLYVVHDFAATSDNQLSIYAGDRIRVQKSGTQGWAFGVNLTNNKSGWFPQGFAQEAFTVR